MSLSDSLEHPSIFSSREWAQICCNLDLSERQKQIAVQLFDAMDIEWTDKDRRQDWVLRGFRQFDAPVSIVITFDKSLDDNDIAIFDCGAVSDLRSAQRTNCELGA